MKEREKEIFTNRGITLVALIITIIVLLILAGVSLSFVFNGGILDKAQQAVNEYQNESEKEQDLLEYTLANGLYFKVVWDIEKINFFSLCVAKQKSFIGFPIQ